MFAKRHEGLPVSNKNVVTQQSHVGLKHAYTRVMADPLYKNALFNMAGTFVLGGLGFVFWIVVARLYATEQVGIATTLISIMTLLSSLTVLGLGSGLMRHLPVSVHKNDLINSSFIIVMLVTIVASIVFLLGLPVFSDKLVFIRSNSLYAILFIVFVIIGSWNTLLENTFMAFRSAGKILLKDLLVGALKLLLPFAFIVSGAFGIFASASVALAVGVLIGLVILIFQFKVRPSFSVNLSLTKGIFKYSFANYLTTFAMNMPPLVLPVIILNTLSAKYAAYYYVALMIQANLQVIPSAATQALLTEGSYNESELKKHVKKAALLIIVLLIPAIVIIFLAGNVVLQFFGQNYAIEGLQFLRLFSTSTLCTAALFIANAILNVKQRIKTLVFLNIVASVLTLGLSYAFISGGLNGVGWGWALGQAMVGVMSGLFIAQVFLRGRRKSRTGGE
jgi:O-antigen/teichoic acid export membrane protein